MIDPKTRPIDQESGVGVLDNGTLNVLTEEQYAKAVIQRNVDEATDALDEEQDLEDGR